MCVALTCRQYSVFNLLAGGGRLPQCDGGSLASHVCGVLARKSRDGPVNTTGHAASRLVMICSWWQRARQACSPWGQPAPACTSQMETGLERKKWRRWPRAPKPAVLSLEKIGVWDRGLLPILQGGYTAAVCSVMTGSPVSARFLLLLPITQVFGDTHREVPGFWVRLKGTWWWGLCSESRSD